MNLGFFRVGLVAFLLLMSASTVFSADDAVELNASEIIMREVSIIGSKYNVKDIAGSAAFLSLEDIREHNIDDINQILRRVPGVNLREEDGYGLFPNISLRGVDSARTSKVTIMEDGVLMAPAPYSSPSAYYSPTTGRMSGIEVMKGSSQVKYGPHTTGGAINYLATSVPTTETIYSKSTFGQFNEIRNHTYFGNTEQNGSGKFGYLIEYYTRSNTGFKELDNRNNNIPDLRGEADTGFTKQEPMVKLFFEPKTALYQRLELKFGHTNLDANETYLGLSTGSFRANPYKRYAASRFDEIESTQYRQHIRHFIEFSPQTNLVTTAYGNTFNRNWQKAHELRTGGAITATTSLADALSTVAGQRVLKGETAGVIRLRNNNRTYYMYGIQSSLNHKLVTAGGTKHNIEMGFRYHYDQIRRMQWNEDLTQAAGGAITARAVGARGTAGDRTQKTKATTVHVTDAIQKGKWTFTPGARMEYIDAEYCEGSCTDGSTVDRGTRDYVVGVGGASLKYDVYETDGRDLDFFTGLHRGFSPAGPRSNIRSGLGKETSLGFELGGRYRNAKKAFATEAIFFHTYINDLIINDSIGGTGAGTSINGGEVRTLGLELSANYDRGLHKGWSLQTPAYVAVTATRATFETDTASDDSESIFSGSKKGNRLPYIPELVVSFGLGAIYQKWSANLDANYQTTSFADGANTGAGPNVNTRFGKIDSRLVMDAALGYQYSKKVRMFSTMKNITSEEYIVSRQPEGARPGAPLTVMGGIEFSL
jgi:Fe(3+) dicitrate transport protein